MKITFIGAAHEVTGSCTLIEVNGYRLLIDCGMEQGADIYENSELPLSPAEIDFAFLTHAHIDHSGKLPLLSKNGFKGKVFTTVATKDLCTIMLADSAHIQETEAIWKNRRAKRSGESEYEPLYTMDDVTAILKQFVTSDYRRTINVAEGITAEFFDAGHLLGSASIKLTLKEDGKTKTVVFSGDIGSKDRPLLSDPMYPDKADVLIIESTYGDRERAPIPAGYEENLASIINRTLNKGGNLVIPSFAVGRTQELLYMIRSIKEKKLVYGDFPVYIDSPLAIEATNIYNGTLSDYYDKESKQLIARGINPIGFEGLRVAVSSDDSKRINTDPTPKIIISASGMCEAGRIRHHLKYNLWRPESTILFVGYQVPGTLGRKLLDGEKFVNLFGEEIKVSASIERLEGFSGHADRELLLSWLGAIGDKPSRVYVNHGEDETCDALAKDIKERYGVEAIAPYSGDSFDLLSGETVTSGSRTRVKRSYGKKKQSQNAPSPAWQRLYSAGMRLINIIERSKSLKSKELSAFTSRINSICDKQEHELRKRRK